MTRAFAGYVTWPLRDTAVILFPWIMTTESGTVAPPFPSISVPPSTTMGACPNARVGNHRAAIAKHQPSIQFVFIIMTFLVKLLKTNLPVFVVGESIHHVSRFAAR